MNKVINRLKSLFYSLPFGLKAADSEIMGANSTGEVDDTVIQQQVNDKRVAKHLLKGEITQEVEELRYRTYKVDKESNKYNSKKKHSFNCQEKLNDFFISKLGTPFLYSHLIFFPL
jgi:hypothetical protein